MDPRHQNQNSVQEDQSLRGPYGFSTAQNDPLNSMFNHESDQAFNSAWDADAFRNSAEPSGGFDQSGHGWHQNTLQMPNLLSMPNYGAPPGGFDQTYSRSPAPFNYAGFNTAPNHSLAGPSYESSMAYGQLPLTDDGQFGFSRHQGFQRSTSQSQTVSPQALQNYPNSFQQNSSQAIRQVCKTAPLMHSV